MKTILCAETGLNTAGADYIAGYLIFAKECNSQEEATQIAKEKEHLADIYLENEYEANHLEQEFDRNGNKINLLNEDFEAVGEFRFDFFVDYDEMTNK